MNESRSWRSPDGVYHVVIEQATTGAGAPERRAALGVQLEELLGRVWACERDWDIEDRIDRTIRYAR